jgi:hypothetical protein
MKRILSIKCHSLEASSKFEGKWIANISTPGEPFPSTYWMSHKQMTSIQRNLDKPVLFAVFDYSKDKPRFVWASTDKAWLAGAFCADQPQEAQEATQPFETAPARVAAIKTKIAYPEPVQREWTEEDLPF